MSQTITIQTDDGSFNGYLAEPKSDSNVGLVVIQEIFGLNQDIRNKADYWGGMGYQTLAPDLFWRLKPDVQLDHRNEKETEKAFALYNQFDINKGVEDIQTAITYLRGHGCERVGVVGYCLGGLLTYLAATRTDSDASASYYGGGIDKYMGEAEKISKPFICHLAEKDEFIDLDAQSTIHAALDKHPQVRLYNYPYVNHAFARENDKNHERCASTLAEHRTGEFFYMNLKLPCFRPNTAA